MSQEKPVVSHSIRNLKPLTLAEFLAWLAWRPMRFRVVEGDADETQAD